MRSSTTWARGLPSGRNHQRGTPALRLPVVCLAGACFGSIVAAADPTPPPPATAPETAVALSGPAARIHDVLQDYHEHARFQGSALVATNGEVIYREGFGPANAELGIPNATGTRHRIASLSKSFTAAIVLQLVGEGTLDLDAAIAHYLPAYRRDHAEQITLHHLLSHTSGIRSEPQDWLDNRYRRPYTLDDLVELANVEGLQFPPGSRYRYSNNAYNLLAAIIERKTGQSFDTVLRERILDPLGMHDTGLVGPDAVSLHCATGYNQLMWGELERAPNRDESYAVGAGGMYSTVDDLYRWNQALWGNTVLSETSRTRMFTPGLGNAGYGWAIGTYTGADGRLNTLVYSYGATGGAASINLRLIEDRHLIILLGNIRQIPHTELATTLANAVIGTPVTPMTPPLEPLYKVLVSQGVEAAVARYADAPDLPTERTVNQLGYELMGRGRLDAAIRVFQFNVAAYPQAWNTYDSLAEGYMNAGDHQNAVEFYLRSLDLNPRNSNAERMLERLDTLPGPF